MRRVTWHEEDGVQLGSDALTVTVLRRGGKIASLRGGDGREWLLQPPTGPLPATRWGASFVGSEMCGWDEMFPTIVSPGRADHGDVWSVEWDLDLPRDATPPQPLAMRVLAGPLELRRTVQVRDGVLDLHYTARSRSDRPLPFLWAAHPQLRLEDHSQLAYEDGLHWLRTDGDRTAGDGPPGDPLSRVPRGGSAKWWTDVASRPTWVRLRHPDGATLTLTWSATELPHLGVWVDAARFAHSPVITPEPSNGWYDDVDRAAAAGHAPVLLPGTTASWHLSADVRPSPRSRLPQASDSRSTPATTS